MDYGEIRGPCQVALVQGKLGELSRGGVSGFKKQNSIEAWLPSTSPQEGPAAPLHHQSGDLDALRLFISKTSEQFLLPWSTH